MKVVDVIVIGGGMAGTAAAACIAQDLEVLLVEREGQPGYHSTGRSAAVFCEVYGNRSVRALTRASREFLHSPPTEFSAENLVKPRGTLYVARPDQLESLNEFASTSDIASRTRRLDASQVRALCPVLRADYAEAGLYEPGSVDINVHALQQAYLRQLRAGRGALRTNAEVLRAEHSNGRWLIETSDGEFAAAVVVNAAGAWVDEIARAAGVSPIGISPRRRTAITIDAPAGMELTTLPLTVGMAEDFYFKPDAGRLMVSPADETPMPPCDVQPDELDIAIAAARFEEVSALEVRQIRSKWAGLRSFAPDRAPVIGFDVRASGFFWLAGQGGYGIQTAPAAGRLTAGLIRNGDVPEDLLEAGLVLSDVAPSRLRAASTSESVALS